MTLEIDGEEVSTGLSPAHIGDGDPRLAGLVLATAIDFHLNAPPQRRASGMEIERLFALLRRTEGSQRSVIAVVAAGLQAGPVSTSSK